MTFRSRPLLLITLIFVLGPVHISGGPVSSGPAAPSMSRGSTSQARNSAASSKDTEIRRSLDRVIVALDAISSNTAEPVELQQLIYNGAIAGALSRLDPFSVFLDEEQFLSMRQQQRGVRQGFGAVLNVQAGRITVLQSVPDSPFARAGLGPGDRIVAVNGQRIAQMGLEELVETLQAARNKKVKLEVLQSGAVVPHDFELDPAEVASPTVDKKFLLPSGAAYLHIDRIEDSTAEEITSALQQLSPQPLSALLLDLRDNPGGSVNGALAVAGLFLPKDSVVVSLKGNSVAETRFLTKADPVYPDVPLVVLINNQSASAAEIIPAALQEHDRAWLVGETTFGKGVAETVMPLSSGTALILTTARYYTPRGRSVQKALPATALADILTEGQQGFTSNSGRPLKSGEGLRPDEVAPRLRRTRLMEALEQSTAFINFAQEVLQRRGKVARDFRATDDVVQQFEAFLRAAGFGAPRQEWDEALPWIRQQIQAEALTLVYGMEAGEQVEILGDPQVQAATAAVGAARDLLAKTQKQ
jgi:carboxyl-terminal processing protease